MKAVIIGTAGRSHKELLTDKTWSNMVAKARELVPKGAMGISGGAAWADHIAVELYRLGHLSQLMLHLPAPIDNVSCCFVGGYMGGPKRVLHQQLTTTMVCSLKYSRETPYRTS